MKNIALTGAALAVAALSWSTSQANARTCFRETVTGPAGHHTVIRCTMAPRHAARTTVTRTTRVVSSDDFIRTPVRTRLTRRFYSAPQEEIVEYGSSSYTAPVQPTTGSSTVYQPDLVTCGPGTSGNWGYTDYYGSNARWTCQASASSHPAFYGGSGQFTFHPGYGWGY